MLTYTSERMNMRETEKSVVFVLWLISGSHCSTVCVENRDLLIMPAHQHTDRDRSPASFTAPPRVMSTNHANAPMISLLSFKGTLRYFIPAMLMHSLWSWGNHKRYAVNQKLKWRCTPPPTTGEPYRLAWPVFVLCVDVENRWDKMDGEVKWATQRVERCMAVHME